MGLHHCIQLCTGSVPAATAEPSVDGMMSTQLYLALCEGRNDEAMAMMAADDQIAGIVSAERNNVLHLAAKQGHAELIQELCDRFGDVSSLVSSQNSAMDTPLHCAARAGHDGAVSLILQLARGCGEEAVLWSKNEAGDTALHLAARLGHGQAVEVIVKAAPDLASEVNDAGVSPLYLAVMSRSVPAVEAITSRCHDASAAGPSSQNALHAAVFQGKRMVGLLLDWKPSLASEADDSGSTPLHFASSDGDSSVVGAILRAVPPCAVRMRDSSGLSALHIAAGMGHEKVAKALIEACPDAADLRDDRGGTFLHAAAREGHSKVVSLVIASKKPKLRFLLDTQDGEGNTPLHLVVAAGAPDVAEALLRKGKVRADVMNNDGQTPLDLAATSTGFFSMLGLVVTLAAFGAQSRPQRRDRVEKCIRDVAQGIEKTSDSLAVVAVLIATVAFTAANNVPGAYDQNIGLAVLRGKTLFKYFMVLDSFALVTSVIAVVLLVFGKASRSAGSWRTFAVALHCIWLSLISMILAFYAAIAGVANTRAVCHVSYHVISTGFAVLNIAVNLMIAPPVSTRTVCKVLWRTLFGKHVIGRRIKQQYPVAGDYAPNLLLFWATNLLAIAAFLVVSTLSERAAS